MITRFRSLLRRALGARAEIMWVVGGQVVAFAGALVALKLLTFSLGPSEYGQLALGLTIAGAVHMFVYGPIEQTVLRFVPSAAERGQLKDLARLLATVQVRAALVFAAVALIAGSFGAAHAGTAWGALVATAVLFSIAVGVNSSAGSMLTAWRQRREVALHQVAEIWLRLGLALAAIHWVAATGGAAIAGYLAGTLIVAASQTLRARAELRSRDAGTPRGMSANLQRQAFAYGLSFVTFATFAAIATYADRWIVLGVLGPEAVGIYAALAQIAAAPIALFSAITNQFMVPLIFGRTGSGETTLQRSRGDRLVRATVIWYLCGMSILAAVAFLLGEPLVEALTSRAFAKHGWLLWIMVVALGLTSIGQTLVLKGLAANRAGLYIAPKALHAFALIALAAWLAPRFGLLGVASAGVASASLYAASAALANRRLDPPPATTY